MSQNNNDQLSADSTDRTPENPSNRSTPGVELPYAGIDTFLKAPHTSISAATDAEVAVFGVPYDGGVSRRPGARFGPRAIRTASSWAGHLFSYPDGVTNTRTGDRLNLHEVDLLDCGDAPVFPSDPVETGESISTHAAALSAADVFPIMIGGDHSCTFPSFVGFAEGANHETVGYLQIDAHADVVPETPVFGDRFHGSTTHNIVQSEFCSAQNVSQVGLSGYDDVNFFETATEAGRAVFTLREVHKKGVEAVIEQALEAIPANIIYVSFDIDAVASAVAPGTGTPEPGGLTAHQAIRVAELVGQHDAVGAFDLMEVAPPHDPTGRTSQLASKLLTTFIEQKFGLI